VTAADHRVEGEIVVLVHGLYMHGVAMLPLYRWLGAGGFRCRRFSYPSLRSSVPQNAARLARCLRDIDTPVVHFLGHSLGGLVVRSMLSQSSWQRPGRVLTLGTPHLGSHAASYLGGNPALAWILGKSLRQGLDGDIPPWPGDREVATIAGDKALGAGRMVPGLPKPNDGTVAVAETELGPDHAHVVLAVTHSSMLISRRVADYACVYLKTGRFPEPESSEAF
jgi:pimeloyl-ACP methyl ester carboxylesterase